MARILRFQDLTRVCEHLMREAESAFGPELDLDQIPGTPDEYWTLDSMYVFDTNDEEQPLGIGSLTDDLELIAARLSGPSRELSDNLEHLRGVLELIAYVSYSGLVPRAGPNAR